MYLEHFGLSRLPFQITPDVSFFFDSRAHSRALSTIVYGISKTEGFVVITGEVGAGKTTLIEYLLSSGMLEDAVAARINTTQLEPDNLLLMIAYGLGLQPRNEGKAAVLHELRGFFAKTAKDGHPVVLIVDEAQNLPTGTLEELRMLSNFQDQERPLLQIILVGQPQFRQRIAGSECEQIRQRVIASYHLTPLQESDIAPYVEHRLVAAGGSGGEIFTPDAYRAIHTETRGVPRKINRLCDRLLLYGYLEDLPTIDAAAVAEVVREMHAEHLGGEDDGPNDVAMNGHGGGLRALSEASRFDGPGEGADSANADGQGDRGDLIRTLHHLRREIADYRRKMERIADFVAREEQKLRRDG